LDQLLFRLYHEDGVRVFESEQLVHRCRCSRKRLLETIQSFSEDDIDHATVEGSIDVNCQFCNTTYKFTPDEVRDK
jgi:molecular chaperone Hsp33